MNSVQFAYTYKIQCNIAYYVMCIKLFGWFYSFNVFTRIEFQFFVVTLLCVRAIVQYIIQLYMRTVSCSSTSSPFFVYLFFIVIIIFWHSMVVLLLGWLVNVFLSSFVRFENIHFISFVVDLFMCRAHNCRSS